MIDHVPVEPFHPAEYINDEMEARGWTQDDLADVMGITRRQLVNLIQGKSGVTPDTAHRLAGAFGQDAETWMHLQVAFEIAVAAKEDRDVAQKAKIYDKVPVRELKRRRWIADVNDADALESEVCRFLGVSDIDDPVSYSAAARKGTSYDTHLPAQRAWYCRVRELAKHVTAARYDESRFEEGVSHLLSLSSDPDDARKIPRALSDMGVRLVIVERLKGTRIDGVALWLSDHEPVIGLSLRYDRIDNLWFNLMHEMVHIKHRDESPVDVDLSQDVPCDLSEMEQRANAEAADYLVPRDKLDSFIQRHRPLYYQKKVVQFAQARGVHPAIVVGQLKRHGGLPETHLNKIQAKIRDVIRGQALTDGWGDVPTLR